MPTYYRVDKRLFVVGEVFTTAQEYYSKFSGVAKDVEDALEAHRPRSLPNRTSCLFVFEEEAAAREHWAKMIAGKLYRVELGGDPVVHRGDMAILDQMKVTAEQRGSVDALADAYWEGNESPSPVIEVLVNKAVVTEVLSVDDQERRSEFMRRYMGRQ